MNINDGFFIAQLVVIAGLVVILVLRWHNAALVLLMAKVLIALIVIHLFYWLSTK